MQTIKRGMSSREAPEYLGISDSTLRIGRMNGFRKNHFPPPPYVKAGRKIIYLKDDLDNWLQAHRVQAGPHMPYQQIAKQ